MAYRCGFAEKALTSSLHQAGFKLIATIMRPNLFDLWALACKSEMDEVQLKNLA